MSLVRFLDISLIFLLAGTASLPAHAEEVPMTIVGDDTYFIPPQAPPPPPVYLDSSPEAAPKRVYRRAPAAAANPAVAPKPMSSPAPAATSIAAPAPRSAQTQNQIQNQNQKPASQLKVDTKNGKPRPGPLQRPGTGHKEGSRRTDWIKLTQAQAESSAPPPLSAGEPAPMTAENPAPPPPTAPETGELAPPAAATTTPPAKGSAATDAELATQPVPVANESPATAAAPEGAGGTQQNVATGEDFQYERVPLYKKHVPQWATQLAMTGNSGFTFPGHDANRIGALLAFEYQPAFIQAIGVLGIGPSVGTYSDFKTENSDQQDFLAGIWEVGGQVRYQARWFREQLIVPVVAYEFENVSYHFLNSISGRTLLKGPSFGAWLLLNPLEPSAASDFYTNFGVSRSYFTVELRNRTGGDGQLVASGKSVFFGLRIEY